MSAPKFKLMLFVHPTNSGQSLARLYKALEFHDYTDYELSIINVQSEPEKAAQHGIVATPSVISFSDTHSQTFTDDLSDVESVRKRCGFKSRNDR